MNLESEIQAMNLIKEKISPHPDFETVLREMCQGSLSQALELLSNVIKKEPENYLLYDMRGFIYLIQDVDLDDAIEDFTQAIQLNSTYLLSYNNRCLANLKQKAYKKLTEENFRQVFQDSLTVLTRDDQNEDARFYHGLAAYKLGGYQTAIQNFLTVLSYKPASNERFCKTNRYLSRAYRKLSEKLQAQNSSHDENSKYDEEAHKAFARGFLGYDIQKQTEEWQWSNKIAVYLAKVEKYLDIPSNTLVAIGSSLPKQSQKRKSILFTNTNEQSSKKPKSVNFSEQLEEFQTSTQVSISFFNSNQHISSNNLVTPLDAETAQKIIIDGLPNLDKATCAEFVRELGRFCRRNSGFNPNAPSSKALIHTAHCLYRIAIDWGNQLAKSEDDFIVTNCKNAIDQDKNIFEPVVFSEYAFQNIIQNTLYEIETYFLTDINTNIFNELFKHLATSLLNIPAPQPLANHFFD